VQYMTTPSGNSDPLDALLASYAVGAVSRPLYALVGSHLALKPDNRMFVSALEGVAANAMETPDIGKVADRDLRLNTIFGNISANTGSIRADDFIPAPLASYLGQDYESLQWKTVMPGLKEVKLEDKAGLEASMLWIKAGRAMPSHTHPGIEATLVLKGSFSDKSGHFGRGDISVVDSDMDHKPVAGEGEDCICFAVSEGPVKLTGRIARIFQRLVRH
jgi:putative transcriptional regulator